MNTLKKANRFLKLFGLFKVPMIFYSRPQVLHLDENEVTIKIPLKRRTKNHLNSMYFGALAVGADIAGGIIAFHIADNTKKKLSLVFKEVNAVFHKRAEGDVFFYCRDGQKIQSMIKTAEQSGERVSEPVTITCVVPSIDPKEVVATYTLTLSIRVKTGK